MSHRLLQVENLEVVYRMGGRSLKVLHDIALHVDPGEVLGIVGESGCGKSTLALAMLGLLPPNAEITHGRILFRGRDLLSLSSAELRGVRGRDIAMVFQDPTTSLNPTFTIRSQMLDALRAHSRRGELSRSEMLARAVASLEQVGMPDPRERIEYFPHQFSGGMRQRIMIAMVLMLEPAMLIADEPTSALDVTLEAQILALLKRMRDEHGTAIIYISHDLGVISQLCDRIVVVYAGRAVEEADVLALFERPLHPYSQALLASVPSRLTRGEELATIPGRVPSFAALPAGCKFANRCPHVQPVCDAIEPNYLELESRRVRCHIYDRDSGFEGHEELLASFEGRHRS